jgi:hypothetical protein
MTTITPLTIVVSSAAAPPAAAAPAAAPVPMDLESNDVTPMDIEDETDSNSMNIE